MGRARRSGLLSQNLSLGPAGAAASSIGDLICPAFSIDFLSAWLGCPTIAVPPPTTDTPPPCVVRRSKYGSR